MAKIRDYQKLANDILNQVGGQENVVSFTRCATRLRLKITNRKRPCLYQKQP
ncbi:hypothetical protein EXA23_07495 [Vibrio cincinnatiensis]|uniref:PTS transporter subunit EIIB n=1 Tax=Vibrio cincinnatiensis TaxID=675 RepID=UPI0012ACCC66|nr:PTS transporter subunit EIIB [Vibrio cincinnatiensis]MCG3723441.1 hypothetical protein [Vibrio cincinnatiensis]MCG3733572.1 hypothetical protein [Vibrio cincinnatiensis]MCG3737461.1 hypothetical protein [Vibrio cincinnatiensis]MCG3739401.1 hypothetical protein [Vibrio cincinnatiensis]MCG3744882.1 hypothetical protein [Vibrio cincinnatiensis]